MTIERISGETGIHSSYLEALERDEFHVLPGRAFGKFYIRAYARMLGFDPQPLIDAYDREVQGARPAATEPAGSNPAPSRPVNSMIASWRQARIAERTKTDNDPLDLAWAEEVAADEADDPAVADEANASGRVGVADEAVESTSDDADDEQHQVATVEAYAVPNHSEALAALDAGSAPGVEVLVPSAGLAADSVSTLQTRSMTPMVVALLALGLLVGLAGVAVLSMGRNPAGNPELPSTAPFKGRSSTSAAVPLREGPILDPSAAKPAAGEPRVSGVEDPRAARRSGPVPEVKTSHASLSVTESGLGRRIVSHQVEGQDDRFPEGTVVWFLTRAVGGEPGDTIRHVWIHDGRAVQSIRLRLGGFDWRTQSSKTLRHVGPWAVEARDEDGRVLARADFACEPPAP